MHHLPMHLGLSVKTDSWKSAGIVNYRPHWLYLELLSCKCARACKFPNCTCIANGLKCTHMCKLKTCENQKLDDMDYYSDESDDEDYDTE